jgi:hypothetical protein
MPWSAPPSEFEKRPARRDVNSVDLPVTV